MGGAEISAKRTRALLTDVERLARRTSLRTVSRAAAPAPGSAGRRPGGPVRVRASARPAAGGAARRSRPSRRAAGAGRCRRPARRSTGCCARRRRLRPDPEVVEEAPEGREHLGRVGGAEARDVQEHEDGQRHEQRRRTEEHLEQAGDQTDDEHVEGPDADEGEDRPERAGVGAEAEAADQVGERRDQDGDRRDVGVAAAGCRAGATVNRRVTAR